MNDGSIASRIREITSHRNSRSSAIHRLMHLSFGRGKRGKKRSRLFPANCDRLARCFRKKLFKNPKLWVAIAILSCLSVCLFTPLNQLLNHGFLTQTLHNLGHGAEYVFVVIYALTTIIGIPATVMTIAGGAVFGLWWGTLWSLVGATLGALGAFWVARYLLRDWIATKFQNHHQLHRFQQAVKVQPLKFTLAVRFAPIAPFNLINFLLALTPINSRDYTVGTFFGIIPGSLLYTWLGVTGEQALTGGDRLPFFLALSFLALLSILPIVACKKN